ncbi:hypothetical protein M427DRAFT_51338 [Gonapodya prolifera JEL478]|uniref:Uncharacterized protein n=1 Tax=Gonapodya prolifera (strain JEL478) TaxID=1344416 RepID=A0A139AZI2_GONPJ|nr:hypothetical protein M427DRAFT_51338 [Gonapodya prolifera JEL478]|eukprot:KXS21973.1 hypothetical protein M427DRAFT_51338 [Gonapodya prolifera JEL478]
MELCCKHFAAIEQFSCILHSNEGYKQFKNQPKCLPSASPSSPWLSPFSSLQPTLPGAIAVQTTPCSKFIQLSQCSATQKPVFVGCVNAMTAIGLFTKDQATTAVNASTAVCDALAANNTELINQFDSGIPATSCSNYASSPEVAAFQQYTSACTAYNAKIGDASRATNIKSAGGLALLVAGVFALL